MLDLVEKIAAVRGERCAPDPEAWYETTFGEAPSYSVLLEKLARTQTERQQLLRSYFEPSPDDASTNTKQPTEAHRVLASLVKRRGPRGADDPGVSARY